MTHPAGENESNIEKLLNQTEDVRTHSIIENVIKGIK